MKIDKNRTKKGYIAFSGSNEEKEMVEQLENLPPFKNSSIYKAIKQFESIKPQLELYEEISKSILIKSINLQEAERLQKISKVLSRNINIKELKECAIKIKKVQETMAYRIGQNESQNKLSISQPKLQLPCFADSTDFTDFIETINKDMKVLIKNTKPFTFKDKIINVIINHGVTTTITIVVSIATVIITSIIYKLF